MGEIIYQGEPPFHLPTTQIGSVRGDCGSVEMTVFASVPGKGPHDVPVRFGISVDEAQTLIVALTRAVREAQRRRR